MLLRRDESGEVDAIYDEKRTEWNLDALLTLLKTYPFDGNAY